MNKVDYLAFPAIVGRPGQYSKMRKQWDDQHYKFHVHRMANVKPLVDNKSPRTYLHCHLNMKKMQMEQDRLLALERDNNLLVSKIARIKAEKGDLDNWNEYKPKPKVNPNVKNQELAKISLENQAILKKISRTKPVYDHKKFLDDFQVTRSYVARLSKY